MGTEKNALAKSITEKYADDGHISFKIVLGSGVIGALGITAELTACKSCTNLHSPLALRTGKRGVLQGESGHGTITPLSINSRITGSIPFSASGFKGY